MKRLLALIILFLIITAFPQQKEYFDAPFGGGGGFAAGWIFPNVSPLNEQLSSMGLPEAAENGLFTSGGAGFIYAGFVPGLRIGGMGFAGSTSEKSARDLFGYTPETVYSIGGGGLTVEYTLPFIKNWGVSPGIILGGGGMQVELYKNQGGKDWNNLPDNSAAEFHYTLSNNYWFVTPTLNIDIPFYRFLNFRLGAGYQLSFAEEWEIDNGQDLDNVPSDLNGKSFFIQAGLFIGFFSF